MKKTRRERIIRWLIRRWMPEYHLRKNPSRKKELPQLPLISGSEPNHHAANDCNKDTATIVEALDVPR
ncbi:MAG: hypothetical protein KAR06_04135 [Deltaproteobacteria bacterium]|nr:hypothetical protein [Deltaproteobacteria bacterium]